MKTRNHGGDRSRALGAAATCGVLLGSALAATGCQWATPAARADRPYAVEIDQEAGRVSRAAGVNLKNLVDDAAAAAYSRLPYRDQITIYVRLDASRSVPEVGLGGHTDPHSGGVILSVDGTPPGGFATAVRTRLPAVLAHELHHSSRIRMGPGYGRTLGEALVSEGLADHFALEAFPHTPPMPHDHALSKVQEHAFWGMAQPDLWRRYRIDDHPRWFFGTSDLPRWTGYTLGYRIAGAYLGAGSSAAGAVRVNARAVMEPYARVA